MKQIYTAPTAELICLAPQESVASLNKNWIWNSNLQNYWGDTKKQTASGNGFWYEFNTNEFN